MERTFMHRESGIRPLKDGFSFEVDGVDKAGWSVACRDFGDRNFYQTWGYETVRSGRSNVSHLLLKRGTSIAAAVQARIARVPILRLGIAYILWAPLWKPQGGTGDPEVFRQAVRAIRAEYVGRRGLGIRLVPPLADGSEGMFREILEEEGYVCQHRGKQYRTIIMDLRPSLAELHNVLHPKWRYHLKKAQRQDVEIVSGEDDSMFQQFESIYDEMVRRKKLTGITDIRHSRMIQKALPPEERMRVFLCKVEGEVCAGGICSTLGDTGIYLFGATSNRGTKTYGSYLVHWNMLEWVKNQGCFWYDLNGIDPETNPGGYQFKSQLAGAHGHEIRFLGQFDAYPGVATRWIVGVADRLRSRMKAQWNWWADVSTIRIGRPSPS